MLTATSVYQIAKKLSTIELRKLYAMISEDMTLKQSPKRGNKKYTFPTSEIEMEIGKRIWTQFFNVKI
jgi:adenylyl- and sulfurtransferase ThiI